MFAFIVLHYKSINETIECLKCLKKLGDFYIIVVDNNSLTDNEFDLISKYTSDIIKLDSNYGFAKANNIGIKYARDKYNTKYYCVINNDVYITQKDFCDEIIKIDNIYNFDMLGPKIASPSGDSVNPFPAYKTIIEVETEIIKTKKLIKIYKSTFLYLLLIIYIRLKHFVKKPIKIQNGANLELNVPLHGCGIIFSKKYIDNYEYPFFNETFLFHEEEFLYNRVVNDSLVSVYDPNLLIFHKEGSSLKQKISNIRKSKLFREKERLKSLLILKKTMTMGEDYEKKRD